LDISHVKGFEGFPLPRVIHRSKRNGFMEKGFRNGRLERRPYLVNITRIEPPRGEMFGERRIIGRWGRQMSFKTNSSRKVER
jgi:hypothetical protein